jgi:hypothetical protein
MAGFKSVLKPENSIVAGVATIAMVAGIYQLDVGPVSSVTASEPYTVPASAAIKKAGYTSLVLVAGIALMARDPNIVILGGAAIFAFHAHYRHANMSDPGTGDIVPPGPAAYSPAQNVVPMAYQAAAG